MPNWTEDQKKAIYEKGDNILVAAAAGSGKTAVLVERIINKIINEDVDIDKLLVVTFTNAAASEVRERILDAIYKKIEEDPTNIKLQRQINLLGKASICTIHSFCLDVIRNYFYELDISANFRIADTTEVELLKQDVIEDLFEEKYFQKDKSFEKLVSTYTNYRDDDKLKELVLKIYEFIQSAPFPIRWLEEKTQMFNLKGKEEISFDKTIWGEILIDEYKNQLIQNITKLQGIYEKTSLIIELEKFSTALQKDLEKLNTIKDLIESNQENLWDKIFECSNNLTFDRWPSDRNCLLELKDTAKTVRDSVKDSMKALNNKFFIYTSKEANEDIISMYENINNLKQLIIEFEDKFKTAKKEKNIIDFHDIEHFALQILLKEDEKGNFVPTDVAKKIRDNFVEIAIDEYQDSNMVQEFILNSISNGNNIFMVGDVKQSIYRFRQARPDLFLNKYKKYELVNDEGKNKDNEGKKIKLFKNFRSRENVLNLCNMVFEQIMTKGLGEMDYTKDEYLNPGANYETKEKIKTFDGKSELHIIDLENEEEPDIWVEQEENEENTNNQEQEEPVENILLESRFVADKIKEIIKSKTKIFDKNVGYRDLEYKDIVILLRSTKDSAPIYEKQLLENEIPTFSDSSPEYLESTEIQTVMSVLKVIDNPLNDIALICVLRSSIGNFTDNDLVKIRLIEKNDSFYNAILKARVSADEELKNKIEAFFTLLDKWRNDQELYTIDELIWNIYKDSNYYNYVGLLNNGKMKQANLRMLFEKAKKFESASFKGLYNFIGFIDKIKSSSKDMQSAKIIGENDNVVRIMSVHKSKGLEFPVVFLCGCSKKFNMMDLNNNILLHQDLGFGPKYISYERRIEYNTLAKEAIKIKLENEMISEEMRVLYVALTRAREKLYITGVEKDYKKSIKEKKDILSIYNEDKVNINLLKKYKSFLNWIELVYLNKESSIKDLIKIEKHSYKKIGKFEMAGEEKIDFIKVLEDKVLKNSSDEELEKIKEKLDWKYKYNSSIGIISKSSVSKVKKEKMEKDNKIKNNNNIGDFLQNAENNNEQEVVNDRLDNSTNNNNLLKPKFYKEEKITAAQKGTLTHLILQKINHKKQNYTYQDIESLLNDLCFRKIITIEEAKAINIDTILEFTKSDLFKSMYRAKEVYKEQPFYIYIPAKEIYETESQDKILVQGIIDLYFIDENNKLVLVDYKTDYVQNENELVEKYKNQLYLYKDALEKALDRKVDKTIIYSIKLQKEIEIP